MEVGHILYKVKDLDGAVERYTQKGFVVEYGKAKNPYNAVVYFSTGPYLELLARTGMPAFIKWFLKLLGKGKMVQRIEFWDNADEGLIGVALETPRNNLEQEKRLLKKYHQKYLMVKSGRNDTKGRKLRALCLFPDEMKIPFLHTRFSIDPKPKNFIHPNGVKAVKSISFGTTRELLPLINELTHDKTLKLFVGDGVHKLEFEKDNNWYPKQYKTRAREIKNDNP